MKTAIILGGGGGIGSAVAKKLAAMDWRVALAGRDLHKLETVGDGLREKIITSLDATKGEQVEEFFSQVKKSTDTIDAVINCVGSILLKPAHLTSDNEFQSVIETNLFSAFNAVRCAAKHGAQGTSVVLISTCAARIGLANHEAIAAAKAAIEGLARSAAATYATKGIRFNVVAPGLVRTPLSERIIQNPQAEAFSRSLHALGRLGDPEDIASAIVYFATDASSWVTGQVLSVDGGLASTKVGR